MSDDLSKPVYKELWDEFKQSMFWPVIYFTITVVVIGLMCLLVNRCVV